MPCFPRPPRQVKFLAGVFGTLVCPPTTWVSPSDHGPFVHYTRTSGSLGHQSFQEESKKRSLQPHPHSSPICNPVAWCRPLCAHLHVSQVTKNEQVPTMLGSCLVLWAEGEPQPSTGGLLCGAMLHIEGKCGSGFNRSKMGAARDSRTVCMFIYS